MNILSEYQFLLLEMYRLGYDMPMICNTRALRYPSNTAIRSLTSHLYKRKFVDSKKLPIRVLIRPCAYQIISNIITVNTVDSNIRRLNIDHIQLWNDGMVRTMAEKILRENIFGASITVGHNSHTGQFALPPYNLKKLEYGDEPHTYDQLPILGDMVEDAGCTVQPIIDLLHNPIPVNTDIRPYTRQNWAMAIKRLLSILAW